jgi:ribosomal protein S18 acetylase RimI-like enzyme
LGDIGATAFSQDRFHDDPMLAPGVADELHREWAKNSIRGTAADAVIVGSVDGEIAGFVTCRLRHDLRPILGKLLGTIVLVATGPQYQGRGLGTAMTIAAMEWFALQKCDLVDVGTQAANKSAQGLYQKCGFVPVSNSITLRCAPFVPASAPTQTLVN